MIKPQGRRGEVAADILTDFPERFADRTRLFALAPDGVRRELVLEDFWDHKGRIILKFATIDSISDAEMLAGCEIQISREERAPLESGAAYVSDLKDCAIAVQEDDAEREIGLIADVMFGAGDAPLLIVREQGGKGKEYMIPYATDYIVSQDLAGKRIVMHLPAGMLDLDAPLSSDEKRRSHDSNDEE